MVDFHLKHVIHILKAIVPEVNLSYQSSLLEHPTRRQNLANTLQPHCADDLTPHHNCLWFFDLTISCLSGYASLIWRSKRGVRRKVEVSVQRRHEPVTHSLSLWSSHLSCCPQRRGTNTGSCTAFLLQDLTYNLTQFFGTQNFRYSYYCGTPEMKK